MSRKDSINKMRELLVTRRNALRKALAGDLSLLKQLREQTGGDVVDAALDAAQDEISSQLAEVESRELANIDRALVRIRNGSYGECEICNGRIPLARLNALPYATSCIECQRAVLATTGAAFWMPVFPTPTCPSVIWKFSRRLTGAIEIPFARRTTTVLPPGVVVSDAERHSAANGVHLVKAI